MVVIMDEHAYKLFDALYDELVITCPKWARVCAKRPFNEYCIDWIQDGSSGYLADVKLKGDKLKVFDACVQFSQDKVVLLSDPQFVLALWKILVEINRRRKARQTKKQ